MQILPKTSVVGRIRHRVGDRRGRNIGVVAAARRQLEFVFYALRDHQVRALQGSRPVAAWRRHPNSRPVRVVQILTPTRGVVAPSD